MNGPRVFPLHFHIGAVFALLILAVGALVSGASYLMTKDSLESAVSDTTVRLSRETLDDVDEFVAPAEMAVRLISHSSLVNMATLDARLTRLALLRDALEASPALQALYVGYANGDFFYVRRLSEDAERTLLAAPKQARYMMQSIVHGENGAEGRRMYLDESLSPIWTAHADALAKQFDPRVRPWYVEAMKSNGLIRTDPYVFYSDQGAGATIAIPTSDRRAVVGGDFRLDALGKLLAHEKSTPGTLIALLDHDGHLLASSDGIMSAHGQNGRQNGALLRPASEFGIPVLTRLAEMAVAPPKASSLQEEAKVGGKQWHMSVDRIVSGGRALSLVSAIPRDELLAGAKSRAIAATGLTVVLVLAAVPVIWLLARAVSRPLRGLVGQAEAIRRFEFGETCATRSSVSEVNTLALAMDEMRQAIRRFLDIIRGVAAEPQLDRVLPMLLRETMQAVNGTAGALYLVRDGAMVAAHAWTRKAGDITAALSDLPLSVVPEFVRNAIQQGAACPGLLAIQDEASGLPGPLVSGGEAHVAAVPLINRQSELVGVMLLLRATSFHSAELALVGALAGLSANAVELRGLVKAQHDLFDAFIRLLGGAIDAKSPHTGGHCTRVPELVKLLAQAACDAREGPFARFEMSASEWEALHVAAWLHDCGKVTTPEFVIDKATKLETLYDRIHEIRMRFEVLKRDAEIRCLQARLAGEDERTAGVRRDAELRQLDDDFAFVATCNEGKEYMDDACVERLKRIASQTWLRTLDDRIGISHEELARRRHTAPSSLPAVEPLLADKPEHCIERISSDRMPPDNPWGFKLDIPALLYNRGELHNLCVTSGTLCREERYKIEEHIVQTQIMLSRLPFPKHLRAVPEIAGNHHETLTGTGYPRRLCKHEMSILARMMAIADVFEALTARDRPYKKAKTLSESVRIMASMMERGRIDPELFELFLVSGAYRRYAEQFMDSAQVDDVDIRQYVARG